MKTITLDEGVEKDKNTIKNKTFADSISCAYQGIRYAFKTEKNFLIYLCLILLFVGINFLLKISIIEHIIVIVSIGTVITAELINTAIEHLSNFITKDYHQEIKYTKDIGAGAVLFSGIVFFLLEGVIICINI